MTSECENGLFQEEWDKLTNIHNKNKGGLKSRQYRATDVCGSSPSLALVVHRRELGTERRRRKRPSPTLVLAPNHYTALAPLVDGRISIFFVHLCVLIIFTIAICTPAVRDIGDEWRERDRVGHSVDNAAPTTAGDAAREYGDKEMGTALACATVSPGDLGVLAGAGVVGGERGVDTEVGAGGEDMQGGVGDQRIEVYGVDVEQSLHGRQMSTERRRRKQLSPNLAFAPNPQRAGHGRRRRVVVETEERDVSPPPPPAPQRPDGSDERRERDPSRTRQRTRCTPPATDEERDADIECAEDAEAGEEDAQSLKGDAISSSPRLLPSQRGLMRADTDTDTSGDDTDLVIPGAVGGVYVGAGSTPASGAEAGWDPVAGVELCLLVDAGRVRSRQRRRRRAGGLRRHARQFEYTRRNGVKKELAMATVGRWINEEIETAHIVAPTDGAHAIETPLSLHAQKPSKCARRCSGMVR
ncbi:hypothetical protein B0H14DRAFT_3143834 [Mycena olivaceomarginata]|nr:hypothetical protein B0H14DRAFT_3143834 [Mycena olivaceomarginata]